MGIFNHQKRHFPTPYKSADIFLNSFQIIIMAIIHQIFHVNCTYCSQEAVCTFLIYTFPILVSCHNNFQDIEIISSDTYYMVKKKIAADIERKTERAKKKPYRYQYTFVLTILIPDIFAWIDWNSREPNQPQPQILIIKRFITQKAVKWGIMRIEPKHPLFSHRHFIHSYIIMRIHLCILSLSKISVRFTFVDGFLFHSSAFNFGWLDSYELYYRMIKRNSIMFSPLCVISKGAFMFIGENEHQPETPSYSLLRYLLPPPPYSGAVYANQTGGHFP